MKRTIRFAALFGVFAALTIGVFASALPANASIEGRRNTAAALTAGSLFEFLNGHPRSGLLLGGASVLAWDRVNEPRYYGYATVPYPYPYTYPAPYPYYVYPYSYPRYDPFFYSDDFGFFGDFDRDHRHFRRFDRDDRRFDRDDRFFGGFGRDDRRFDRDDRSFRDSDRGDRGFRSEEHGSGDRDHGDRR